MQLATAVMACRALTVLCFNWCAPSLGETDQEGFIFGIFRVKRARTVAGFADFFFVFIFRIQSKNFRMHSTAEVAIFLIVAGDAGFLADVGGFLRQY